MRIYNPIYPSIKDNLEELFGKAPTSITLTTYSAQYSIADQGTCKIKGYVYPQDAVNQQVLMTYTSQKEGSILTYFINYGEDSIGKYFEISVSTTTEDVYSITVKAKGNSSVQADIFTLTAISEVPVTSVTITKTTPSDFEMTVGEDIILTVSIVPSNYTENIQIYGTIDNIINEDWDITKTTSNGYQLTYNTVEPGTFDFGATVRKESGQLLAQKSFAITVKKAITSMTDSQLTAHLSERRFENLLDSSHFESIEEIAQFVREKDFHDIYIGDYIPVTLPWCYWNSYNRSMTTKNLSVQTNLRVVDINYLLNKNVGITTNHLILWPDTIIGIGPMSDTENIQSEFVQMGRQIGRGYYNNYMVNTVLPYIRNKLTTALGGKYLLTYTDSVPVYYSNSTWGGTMNQVSYQSVANTSLRLPNSVVYGYLTGTDKNNSIWNTSFRLLSTNSEYTQKETPSGATDSQTGTITTDIQADESSLQADALSWRIRDGGAGRFTMGYEEGDNPICPIIIFG